MWIASPDDSGVRQSHEMKKRLDAFSLTTLEHVVKLQDFHELSPNPHARAQSRRRILWHKRHPIAAQLIERRAIEILEIHSVEEDVPAFDPAVLPSIAQQLIGKRRFPTA